MFHLLAQSNTNDAAGAAIAGMGFMAYCGAFIVLYVVLALALSTIARKLGKTEHAMWAWIPILQVLLIAELAGEPVWMGVLTIFVGVVGIYLFWKICEARGKPGWISLLMLVPCVGFAVPLYVAYSD